MNDKIDIVITYVDDSNEKWRTDFTYWKNYEIANGIISRNSKQAFGAERTRNWNFLKYWFRSVEKNCPWVNKVFLVVQNEEQLPKWLNTKCKKLRVVYHDEFIPEELLPTFNSCTIGLFVSNIKDLSDNFIMCDDDYFFMNEIKKDRFFKNNIAQHENNRVAFGHYYDGDEFLHILNNTTDFEERYMGSEKIKYHFYHLPNAHTKSFDNKILKDNYEDIMACQKPSKFRYKTNITYDMYSNIMKLQKKCYIGEKGHVFYNCGYVVLKDGVDFNSYKDKDMVCFNDTDLADRNFEQVRDDLNLFLKNIFDKKSKFEK